jgi:hypothetical protein
MLRAWPLAVSLPPCCIALCSPLSTPLARTPAACACLLAVALRAGRARAGRSRAHPHTPPVTPVNTHRVPCSQPKRHCEGCVHVRSRSLARLALSTTQGCPRRQSAPPAHGTGAAAPLAAAGEGTAGTARPPPAACGWPPSAAGRGAAARRARARGAAQPSARARGAAPHSVHPHLWLNAQRGFTQLQHLNWGRRTTPRATGDGGKCGVV